MLPLIVAYILGMLTILTIVLAITIFDWLIDKASDTHGNPNPPSDPR